MSTHSDWSWNALPAKYLELPYFNLDLEIREDMVEQCVWSNEEPRCEQPQCRQQMHTVNSGAAECEEQPGDQVACEEPTKLSMDVTPELEDLPKSQPHHQALKYKSSSVRSLLRQLECATYNCTDLEALGCLSENLQSALVTFNEHLPKDSNGLLLCADTPNTLERKQQITRSQELIKRAKLARYGRLSSGRKPGRVSLSSKMRHRAGRRAEVEKKRLQLRQHNKASAGVKKGLQGPNTSIVQVQDNIYGAKLPTPSYSQPSASSSSSLNEVNVMQDNLYGAKVIYLPQPFCQSMIDGRETSTACTVISALNIHYWLNLKQAFPASTVTDVFVQCIRSGNAVYDKANVGGQFLSVYDAIHLLEHTGIRPRPRSDFGLRSIESLAEKLSSCCEEAQSNACVLGGVLVQNPFSVSIVFYRCGTVVLFDSHIHGAHGAAVAILPHTWLDAAKFVSAQVGPIKDAHLCLLSI